VRGLTKTVIRVAPCGRGDEKPASVRKGERRQGRGGEGDDPLEGKASDTPCLHRTDR
jgi:hypothetical protein